jgi:hypothetical protein
MISDENGGRAWKIRFEFHRVGSRHDLGLTIPQSLLLRADQLIE